MSYLVLARKYRPRVFGDVAGQGVVTGVLKGALAEGRVGHAYLFAGPRGTGKTTTARIFAKALNCETGPTADPCGTCERCVAADEGTELDIVEIDAASHTGVDHIRDLRDQAAYAPMRARFKVYVIDEVHMLSKGAFNALLKTLEEPPAHVKFLFATTELHKLPDTIVSRCQVMRLAPISEADIQGRLEEVARAEGLKPAEGVLAELARRARGGMRDALSLMDQLLALAGTEPGLEDLDRLAGDAGAREVDRLLAAIESGERTAVLEALPEREGGEAELVAAVLQHLRLCLLSAVVGSESPLFQGGEEERRAAIERGERLGVERLELWMEEWLAVRERMRLLPGQERLIVEMTAFLLCRPEATLPLAELEARLRSLEARLGGAPAPASPAAKPASPQASKPAAAPAAKPARPPAAPASKPAPPAVSQPEAAPPASREPTATLEPASPAPASPASPAKAGTGPEEVWRGVVEALSKSRPSWGELLSRRARLVRLGSGRAGVELTPKSDEDRSMAEDRRNLKALQRALEAQVGGTVEVSLAFAGEQQVAAPKPDAFTQEVADLFGGIIEEGS